MATQSIFHNIIIKDSKTAESFINALEYAAAASKETTQRNISSKDLSKEEIKKFFGVNRND